MNWTLIIGIILAVVRLIESIFQWWNGPDTKNAFQAIVTIFKNFFLSIETYKKK